VAIDSSWTEVVYESERYQWLHTKAVYVLLYGRMLTVNVKDLTLKACTKIGKKPLS
jgi:hypothetical protein